MLVYLCNSESFVSYRSVSLYPAFCANAGIWREEPRGFDDGTASPAEDEERLDAHGTKTFRPLRSR